MRFWLVIAVAALLLLGLLTAIGWYSYRARPAAPLVPTEPPTTAPAPQRPEPTGMAPPPRVQAYSDLLRTLPGMADALISEEKVPLDQAARIALPHWAYVCPRRDLWISHPEAPPLSLVSEQGSRGVHLSREQVVFVHWFRAGRSYRPLPVTRSEAGEFAVAPRSAEPVRLARRDYHWNYAVSIEGGFAVPTDRGVSFIHAGDAITEEHQELSDRPGSVPCIELTLNGFIAWVTDSPAKVAWFSKGKWEKLPGDWSRRYLHLVPFTDGSVLQINADAMGKVSLRIAPLETAAPDAAKIKTLVRDLSDDDSAVRDEAHAQLAAMGPAAWDVLEPLAAAQQGEAKLRLEEIIRSRERPTLGRFTLMDDLLRPIWRLRDGVVFLAESGVRVQSGGVEEEITPAWIAIRRGRPVELVPPTLARHLAVGSIDVQAVGSEWVVSDAMGGAQLFFGQELIPLTKEKDFRYRKLAGIDRQSRVLLAPVDAKPYGTDFLLIDSWIADPTPILQIWSMDVAGAEAGWSADGWPAVKRGGAFVLKESAWDALKGELVALAPAPATRPAADGTLTQVPGRVDGATVWVSDAAIELQTSDGKAIRQQRPAELPTGALAGAVAGDRLYLVHSGGGISRIRINPGSERPFTVEAVFTEDVPYISQVMRMWVDPAGRVCIITPEPKVVILFPQRKISPAIMDLIPEGELKQARPK